MRVLAFVAVVTVPLLAALGGADAPNNRLSPRALREVVPNDNRRAAGIRRGDTVTARLTVEMARWTPEGPTHISVDVAAMAEEGKAPVIPAPLLRVRTGTVLKVSVRNAIPDSIVRVFGLWSHPSSGTDTVVIAPGATKTFTFTAGAPGTYLYGARPGAQLTKNGVMERETAMGAFVVDPAGPVPPDRIFVMNIWGNPIDTTDYSNALTINGLSWPLTERVQATTGDTLRWRIINATIRSHPMHMHGFYFTRVSKGTANSDSTFVPADRIDEVTDRMAAFSTLALEWTPTRSGNWLFHCHIAYHFVPEAAQLTPPGSGSAHSHSADAGEHMRGLILGVVVKPRPGDPVESRVGARQLRLDVVERAPFSDKRRRMQYFLSEGHPDTTAAWRAGGPLLVLRQGQPTDITVANHLTGATAVHWHGIELESYSDGVVGWSGAAARLAPPIAPADSFVAHLSLPRAGTFIYHTHLDDLIQLSSGLYGGIVVLPPGETFDASRDHVLLVGLEGSDDAPFVRVNGDSTAPTPLAMRIGEQHRFRLIDILPANDMRFYLTRDSTPAQWTPVAKDGADLPRSRRVAGPATTRLTVGETRDFLFTPAVAGEYTLRATVADALPGWRQKIIVRP